jgi:NAD(P)-dependent dehydrogenase (short-subunit alcohol dehydrogenase family)
MKRVPRFLHHEETCMNQHPAVAAGRVAVVTGAASGIGLAAAERFADLGMKICMADANAAALDAAAADVAGRTKRQANVLAVPTDVSRRDEVEGLRERVYENFGEVAVLMNNAGREGSGSGIFGSLERWEDLIGTNLWGVIHGVQVFGPAMIAQKTPAAIVNTGSKQGITCPPGNTAYNVTKAGVKVVTEALAHELRNIEGCQVTAHLLVPGFTFTGLTAASAKPPAAWTPAEVIDFLLPAMAKGDFYILCPDNDVTRKIDEKRIRWAAEDLIENRPALSRWHPDFKDAFAEFMQS